MSSTYTLKQRIILAIGPPIASIVALALGSDTPLRTHLRTRRHRRLRCPSTRCLRLLASLPAHRCLALPQLRSHSPRQPQLRRRTLHPHRKTHGLPHRPRLQLTRRSPRPSQPTARLPRRPLLRHHRRRSPRTGHGRQIRSRPSRQTRLTLPSVPATFTPIEPGSSDRGIASSSPNRFSKVTVAWTRPEAADQGTSLQAALDRSVVSGPIREYCEKIYQKSGMFFRPPKLRAYPPANDPRLSITTTLRTTKNRHTNARIRFQFRPTRKS